MLNIRIATFVIGLGLTVPAFAQTTFEQMAPENSFVVVGFDNMESAIDKVKQTSLWKLWESDQFKDMSKELIDSFAEGLTKMYEDLGVEEGSLTPPSGAAGLAFYFVTNEDTGMPQIAMFAFADYGDRADKFSELIDAAIEEAQTNWDTQFDVEDILGREVRVIVKPEQEDDADADAGEDFDDMGNPFMPDLTGLKESLDRTYYLREGNLFFASSEPESLRIALEALEGEEPVSLASREDFQQARAQVGRADGYGLMLTRDFGSVVDAVDDSGMVRMMAGPMVPAILGDIKAFGFGYESAGSTAMLEATYTIFMPNGKGGIFTLLDTATQRGDMPSFVGPNTVSYDEYNFEFGGVVDFVRNVVNSNPMLAMQLGEQMPQIEDTLQKICDPLDDKVYVVSTLRKPIEIDSLGNLFAIGCHDPEAFEALIAEQGPAFGLEPRDFLGHRIYTLENSFLPMAGSSGSSLSVGLGGGYLFLGSTPAVEQGLRTVGQGDLASLKDDEQFTRAVNMLPKEAATMWGYSDLLQSMQAAGRIARLNQEATIRQMEEFDPEMAAEMKADLEAEDDIWSKIDFKMLENYLGPSIFHVSSTDDGFVVKAYMLDAGAE